MTTFDLSPSDRLSTTETAESVTRSALHEQTGRGHTGVVHPTGSGLRAGVARQVLTRVARRVPVDIALPDGSLLAPRAPEAGRQPRIDVIRPDAFFSRLAAHPKVGIGESYMAGDWQVAPGHDLAEVLLPFAERVTSAVPPALRWLQRTVQTPIPQAMRNSLRGSKRNIEAHYDLSNELFEAFLDPSLMYSSALFDPRAPLGEQDHTQAQVRKVEAMLDLAEVRRGSRVLEIGTGWGTLAIRAAQRGAHVTTLTLSREQAALAQTRVDAAGLSDLVDIRLEDYREAGGSYDAVVSVEMIEAVGEEFWPHYFATLDARLAPGGVVALQSILMGHDRYRATRNSFGWIQKHIFPGGLIPSEQAIHDLTEKHTTLQVESVSSFGRHYAETLRRWRHEFNARWSEIEAHGFDETFRRKWEFYLAYCEAGFDADYIDVAQIRMTRNSKVEVQS